MEGEGMGVTLMVINHSITHLSEFRQEGAREGQRGLNWDGGMQRERESEEEIG